MEQSSLVISVSPSVLSLTRASFAGAAPRPWALGESQRLGSGTSLDKSQNV